MSSRLLLRWSDLRQAGRTASELARFLAALVTIFSSSVGAAALSWLLNARVFGLPLSPLFAGIAVGIPLAYLAMSRTLLNTPRFRWLVRGYRWIQAEFVYQIDSDGVHYTQWVNIVLEAMEPGVDHFENHYRWTGKGRPHEITVLSPGHRLIGPPFDSGDYKEYYIHFGKELAVGEPVEVRVKQDFYDDEHQAKPFLYKEINEPIHHLTLRVIFPVDHLPQNAYTVVSPPQAQGGGAALGAFRARPTTSPEECIMAPVRVDRHTGDCRFDVVDPRFGYRYEIRWEY